MRAAMACLVVVPPLCPRLPALPHIRNHRRGRPRLHTPPEWRVAARARALQHTRRWAGISLALLHPRGAPSVKPRTS
jgi:hypothetical protein